MSADSAVDERVQPVAAPCVHGHWHQHKVVPVSSLANGDGGSLTKNIHVGIKAATATGGGRGGRRVSGLIQLADLAELDHNGFPKTKNFWRDWAEGKVAALSFVAVLATPILSLTFGGAWLGYVLARDSVKKSDVNEQGRWFGHHLVECKSSRNEQDAWFIMYCASLVGLPTMRFALAIAQSHIMRASNIWPHTFGDAVVVTLGGWWIAYRNFENLSSTGLLVFVASLFFSYNVVGSVSRRLAQFQASMHRKRAKNLVKKVCQDIALGLVLATMGNMSWLYLIASERIGGSMDVFINGLLYPALCAGFRVLLQRINKQSLHLRQNQDYDRLLEVAAVTSSTIVSF